MAAFHVRPMQFADVDQVVEVHMRAFEGTPNVRLGKRYAMALIDTLITRRDGITLVAAQNAVVVGYVAGLPFAALSSLSRQLMPSALIAMATTPRVLLDDTVRAKLKERLMRLVRAEHETSPAFREPASCLLAIGVDHAARGQGVAGALIDGFVDASQQRAMASVVLSVYADNTAARKSYSRAGFRCVPSPQFQGRAFYYEKDLLHTDNKTQVSGAA